MLRACVLCQDASLRACYFGRVQNARVLGQVVKEKKLYQAYC